MSQTYTLGKVSLTPRGSYSPDTTYEALDVVTYNGSGYIVLQSVTGVTPPNPTYYQVIASKGDTGDNGQSPTISVGTVSSGSPASVTNVGTDVNAVFDFVLPTPQTTPMVITESNDALNKTYSEISSAMQSGTPIVFSFNFNGADAIGYQPISLIQSGNQYICVIQIPDSDAPYNVYSASSASGTLTR